MAFCTKCGNELKPGTKFCVKCGAKVESPFTAPEETAAMQETEISEDVQGTPAKGFDYQPSKPPLPGYGPRELYQEASKKSMVLPFVLGFVGAFFLGGAVFFGGSRVVNGHFPWESAKEARADRDVKDKEKEDKDKENDKDKYVAEEEAPEDGSEGEKSGDTAADEEASETAVSGYETVLAKVKNLSPANLRFVSSDVSEYPTVKLYYQVLDGGSQPITLSSPTAGIRESIGGGQYIEREVRRIERLEGKQGISIDIIADKSGSMDVSMPQMQSVMHSFVNSLDYTHGDRAELIAFEDATMYMCSYTNNTQLLDNGINSMTAYGRTALYDAALEGVRNAAAQPGAKLVIVFTDGIDNASIHTADEVIYEANANDVPVYIVGTADADAGILTNIAQSTGGRYWNIGQITDLGQILNEIYREQKEMYCIEYLSDQTLDAYAARNVECVLGDNTTGGQSSDGFTAVRTIEHVYHANRYELVKATVSWSQANTEAIAKGGHLITITSQQEMNMASQMAQAAGLKYVWMGGYTMINGNTAFGHWVTGEDFSQYTAWYPGEPSRNDLDGTSEMYLMLWCVDGVWSWNDQRNDPARDFSYFSGKTGYIIEYED